MAVARVAWKAQNGTARELSVTIEDISRSGACIRISVPISVESKLIVDWREGRFSGVSKYCRAVGDEYSVGIRRDAPEVAARAKASTEVATSSMESAASENVREVPADTESISKASSASNVPEEVPVLSAVIHPGATHDNRADHKTESASFLDVWRVTKRDMERFAVRDPDQPSHREKRSHMLSKWLKPVPKQDRKNVPNGSSNGARTEWRRPYAGGTSQ